MPTVKKSELFKTSDAVSSLEDVAESLRRVSETITSATEPWRFRYTEYAEIYHKWFPDKEFTVTNFKNLPKDIIHLFGTDCLCHLIEEALDIESTPAVASGARKIIKGTIKKLILVYHIDSIDIKDELKKRGRSDIEIERALRYFL
jgi:hypothetical protein